MLGLTEDDVAAAVTVVERVLAHEVVGRARSAREREACPQRDFGAGPAV